MDDNKTPIDVRRAAVPGALHGSFTLELELPAPPQDVFAAYGELPLRKKWSRMPGTPDNGGHKLDFRVGSGSESLAVTGAGQDEVAHLKGGTRLQLNGLLAAIRT